ncbi:hypothetical protein BDW68DRAFT_152891 [Aspergillus falconensis]
MIVVSPPMIRRHQKHTVVRQIVTEAATVICRMSLFLVFPSMVMETARVRVRPQDGDGDTFEYDRP